MIVVIFKNYLRFQSSFRIPFKSNDIHRCILGIIIIDGLSTLQCLDNILEFSYPAPVCHDENLNNLTFGLLDSNGFFWSKEFCCNFVDEALSSHHNIVPTFSLLRLISPQFHPSFISFLLESTEGRSFENAATLLAEP